MRTTTETSRDVALSAQLAGEMHDALRGAWSGLRGPRDGSYASQLLRDIERGRARPCVMLVRAVLSAFRDGQRDPSRLTAVFDRGRSLVLASVLPELPACFDAADECESLEEAAFNAAQARYRRHRTDGNAAALVAAWHRYRPVAERMALNVEARHFGGRAVA